MKEKNPTIRIKWDDYGKIVGENVPMRNKIFGKLKLEKFVFPNKKATEYSVYTYIRWPWFLILYPFYFLKSFGYALWNEGLANMEFPERKVFIYKHYSWDQDKKYSEIDAYWNKRRKDS